MVAALDLTGNASSVHQEGRKARELVEAPRRAIATLAGVAPRNVILTGGASEANNLALSVDMHVHGNVRSCSRLLVSAVEHHSVLAGGRFPQDRITVIPVDRNGVIDLAALRNALEIEKAAGGPALVSVMAVNNETGVIEPIAELAELVRDHDALLHVDAVAAVGRLPCDWIAKGADMMCISGHKIGGPQGTGALILKSEDVYPAALIKGGGQEFGRRGGTENAAGLAGFGVAAQLAMFDPAEAERQRFLRDRLEDGLRAINPEVVIFGANVERVANTCCFAVPGVAAETALIALDLSGIAVSSGAACSSGKVAPSHVLHAMGVDDALARGAIRVSFGWASVADDVDRFLEAWRQFDRD